MFLNGIRRAFSSGRRIAGLVFFGLYLYAMFFRHLFSGGAVRQRESFNNFGDVLAPAGQISLPMLSAVAFSGFLLLTFLSMFSLPNYIGMYRRADVDILFTTPVDRRLILTMRFVRDVLITNLVPLVFILVFFRPITTGVQIGLDKASPGTFSDLYRMGFLSYLLQSLVWVSWSYALSLYVNRPEERFEKMRRLVNWAIFAVILLTCLAITLSLRTNFSVEGFIATLQMIVLKVVYFIPWLGTELAIVPLTQNWVLAGAIAGSFLGLTGLGLWVALRQESWAYDIVAQRTTATQEVMELQKKGDVYGILAQQARMGKVKSGRTAWLQRLKLKGEWALVWKEAVLFFRVGTFFWFLGVALGAMLVYMFIFVSSQAKRAPDTVALIGVAVSMFVAIATSGGFQTGGILELLRRGDLQKPLPFAPGRVILFEMLGRLIPSGVAGLLILLAWIVVKPGQTLSSIAIFIACFSAFLGILSSSFMTTIMFPDIDDPTQRGFRGLMGLLALLVTVGPGVGLFILIFALSKSVVMAALAGAVVNLGLAAVCAAVSGRYYADFNPSE